MSETALRMTAASVLVHGNLLAIALGLATIVRVLHFQAVRIRELPGERALGAGQQT